VSSEAKLEKVLDPTRTPVGQHRMISHSGLSGPRLNSRRDAERNVKQDWYSDTVLRIERDA
jgi:hypothetical protein